MTVVADADGFQRALQALTDPELRVLWLRQRLAARPAGSAARMLDELARRNEAGDPRARDVLTTLAMLFAREPGRQLVDELRACAEQEHLLSLGRIVRKGPAEPPPGSVSVSDAVPDYGTGRELTLGERRALARRPMRRNFDRLLADPHPMVTRLLLANPKLTEDDVMRIVTRRPANLAALLEVACKERWMVRPRVRLGLILNPATPHHIAAPLVVLCNRRELREVVISTELDGTLRTIARELLERRPPAEAGQHHTLQ